MMVKDALHNQLTDIYNKKGFDVLVEKSWKIMELSENNASQEKYRQVKGEIAEIVLEYALCEVQKHLTFPSVVLKGLCIPFRTGRNLTTEMDLVFITPYKIYMFECKSYKNRPVITKECLLNGKTDVYKQHKLHTIALNQYISKYILSVKDRPYKCIFFEMSTEGVDDRRDDTWKKAIPVVNPENFVEYMVQSFKTYNKELIDVKGCIQILDKLDKNSDKMFKEHLKRLRGI